MHLGAHCIMARSSYQALLTHPKTQKRQTTGVQWNSDCFADTHSTSSSGYDGSPKEAYLGDPERVIPNLTSRVEYCYPRRPWPWPVTTTILRVFNGYAPRNWDPTSDPRNKTTTENNDKSETIPSAGDKTIGLYRPLRN